MSTDAFGRPQTVLVIGASSDIAEATLALLGGTVRRAALAGRHPDRLAVTGIPGLDAETRAFAFDAALAHDHRQLVADVVGWLGDIDVAIVAHGDLGEPFGLDTDPAEVARLIAVNHAGAASISQAIAQQLAAQGHGTLVAVSSVAAIRPRLPNLPYASAKAGYDSFALGLDHALAGTGARVMVVRPGFVHTKMTEGRPEQPLAVDAHTVAEAIVEGLAKKRSVVWVPKPLKAAPAFRLVPTGVWRRISER